MRESVILSMRNVACGVLAGLAATAPQACKLSKPSILTEEGVTEPAVPEMAEETVHGTVVTNEQRREILTVLGIATEPSSPLGNEPQTLIAQSSQSFDDPATELPGAEGSDTLSEPFESLALLAGDPYVETCRAAGVPIPPPWGDPSWVKVAQLTSGRIFALDPRLDTILYSYQDPKVAGGCAALPRMRNGGIVALGIICQSATGRACFWDNKARLASVDPSGRRFQATISDPGQIRPEIVANGDSLIENCTACHRGSNVFILHHEDMLALPASGAKDTYVPVSGQSTWANKPLSSSTVPQCATCHDDSNRLGALDLQYCSTVILPSISSFRWQQNQVGQWQVVDIHGGKGAPMPPAGETKADYARDIALIKSECKKAYAAAGMPWVWDVAP